MSLRCVLFTCMIFSTLDHPLTERRQLKAVSRNKGFYIESGVGE